MPDFGRDNTDQEAKPEVKEAEIETAEKEEQKEEVKNEDPDFCSSSSSSGD